MDLYNKGRKEYLIILFMIPEKIKNASRDLRKNMTEAEVILWNILK
jgi:very-short-patch-repair endonuclease